MSKLMIKLNDIVKITNRDNLLTIGYDLSHIPEDSELIVGYIHDSEIMEHYYMKELLDNGLYSVEDLRDKEVYILYYYTKNSTRSICVIDDDIELVSSHIKSDIKIDDSILNDILNSYIKFDSIFFEGILGKDDYVGKIRSGAFSKDMMLGIIDKTHSLPCWDSLFDYMEDDTREWLSDVENEEFDLCEKIRGL